ncbi:MAG: DUF4926 domain-containing protein [Phormidesmis sp. CAN_BIN44]|nr:DUF4926 domain-containing protein [Phormidesmis sp. CAN_BIN44]
MMASSDFCKKSIPEYNLCSGSVGTVVEFYPMPEGQEDGHSIEGLIPQDTIELSESQLELIPVSISQARS